MTSVPNSNNQRKVLRQQLQVQREKLRRMFNPEPPSDNDAFPRSMALRMLTGKSTLMMIFLAKALPLLLRFYMARFSNKTNR
ncbi:hypothetical protein DN062_00025 [Nitrincola tibetensis]|uniref:Uncharacterized protein n=1 Tax=Nitrincola tibetensis TaxID=2219697 RepID=A0A364NQX9_9GAMM|nr:hypothetical protein [Nitrincola tibetensis]RAU19518.1 hypothetical protein DN062_00025 [Nitrincola tibetensis]